MACIIHFIDLIHIRHSVKIPIFFVHMRGVLNFNRFFLISIINSYINFVYFFRICTLKMIDNRQQSEKFKNSSLQMCTMQINLIKNLSQWIQMSNNWFFLFLLIDESTFNEKHPQPTKFIEMSRDSASEFGTIQKI